MKNKRLFHRQFNIQFAGLKLGNHQFEFLLEKPFFENFPALDFVENGSIKANLNIEKQKTLMVFQFNLTGNIETTCYRCGDEITQPIQTSQNLYIKFGNHFDEANDELIVLPENEYQINIETYLYEYLFLAIPSRIVHPEGLCNKEALKKLDTILVTSIADEANTNNKKLTETNTQNIENIDPRWEALKKINKNA